MSNLLVGLVVVVVNAMLMPLAVELVKEQAPHIAYRVVQAAAQLMPAADRDRYAYEWAAELDELAGKNVTQLCFAIRVLATAPATHRALAFGDSYVRFVERLGFVLGRHVLSVEVSRARTATYEWFWRQLVTMGAFLLKWAPGRWETPLMVVVHRKGEPAAADEFTQRAAELDVVYWTGHAHTTTALVLEGGDFTSERLFEIGRQFEQRMALVVVDYCRSGR
ncbi:hypothetical protein [Nonomuraea guangzhouensis]|uniref:Uncharacterized protein n=1 Tax=Nonomuraea guangzhouensis TaxID=1291555 RepID=A0ABW4GU24_9ACTN|nr:hypothetical protein [Nonomuraea guangzhouensis]